MTDIPGHSDARQDWFATSTQMRGHEQQGRSTGLMAAWVGFMLIFPIYLLPSGGLQVSALFVGLIGLFSLARPWPVARDQSNILLLGGALITYILAVSAAFAVVWANFEFLRSPMFFVYNFGLLTLLFIGFANAGGAFLRVIAIATVASLAVQVALIPIMVAEQIEGERLHLLFNNPNQLGYFGLLCAGIVAVASNIGVISKRLGYLGLFLAGILVVVSISRAAILGYVLIVFAAVPLIYSLLAGAVVILLVIGDLLPVDVIGSFERRSTMKSFGLEANLMSDRGWARAFQDPTNLLFGIGESREANLQRFGLTLEVHSTFLQMFLGYGLIGFLAFILLILLFLSGQTALMVWVSLAVLSYGLTHNGIRFSMFWVYLGFVSCAALMMRQIRQSVPGSEDGSR